MRTVRDAKGQLVKFGLYRVRPVVESLYLFAELADLVLQRLGILAGLFPDAYLFGAGVAAFLKLFDLEEDLAAFLVQLLITVQRKGVAARSQHLRQFVIVFADPFCVKH